MSRMPVRFPPWLPTYASSRERFGVNECCRFSVQFHMYGVVMLRATLMMGQGFAEQSSLVVLTLLPNRGTPLSHCGRIGGIDKLPAVIVPPAVSPAASITAPVGTLERPNA